MHHILCYNYEENETGRKHEERETSEETEEESVKFR